MLDAVLRDDVRGYVSVALGDPDGVLIGDDTGEWLQATLAIRAHVPVEVLSDTI